MQNIQYLELVNVRASYEDKRFVHIRSGPKPTLRENKSVSDVINFTLMIKIFRLRLVSEEFSLKPDLIIWTKSQSATINKIHPYNLIHILCSKLLHKDITRPYIYHITAIV